MEGDTHPWRSIGHATWYDSLAILEDPSSGAFKDAVKKETTAWKRALQPYTKQVQRWESAFRKTIQTAMPAEPEYANEVIHWQTYSIHIQHTTGHRLNIWCMNDRRVEMEYAGISGFGVDVNSDLYYVLDDIGNGDETLRLSVYRGKTVLWTIAPVGPNAAFLADRILYQTVENHLRYPGIVSVKKETGTHRKTIFEEPDRRFQVDLVQPPYQSGVFVKIFNALHQRIGEIRDGSVKWMTAMQNCSLFPIGPRCYGTNTEIVLDSKHYALLENEFFHDAIWFETDILFTTTHHARMSLYVFDTITKQMKRLYSKPYPSEIIVRKFASTPTLEIGSPYASSQIYQYIQHTLKKVVTYPEPVTLEFRHGFAFSKDGTKVPYSLVYEARTKPSRLFIEGYGSYGISSKRTYPIARLAWIQKGYAYAVSFARGGREDGDRWYDGGRTASRKQNTFDDTAAVIETLQRKYHFQAAHTIFYGRSAGGLLAANIAQQYPHLVGAVYAEVPYLDVLRTTTNPNLPLTQLEYDEFGDPTHRPADYKALQRISPVDTVPYAWKKSPLILVKTALHDSQVLPYEALKWAIKLRANAWTVYVGIDSQGGHFVKPSNLFRSLAEDAAILTNYTRSKTRRRPRQSSRGTMRRRTSSLKH